MKIIYKNLNNGTLDIVTEDGKITYLGKTPEDGIDLNGKNVYAGLVDVHSHGCIGHDVMDGAEGFYEMLKFQASHGVTSWLATTMTVDMENIKAVVNAELPIGEGIANCIGFHAEGPYISAKYKGAQNEKYIKAPDLAEFSELKNVKMVTIAPELDGAEDFIKNCNCVVSLGHTDCDYDTAIKAINSGASCLTHTFNAMPAIHHRNPGPIGAAAEKEIYAQVICDGLHIHKAAILMLYKIFGSDKMVLISDSMRATGMPNGEYDLGGLNIIVKDGAARLADGTLAGSTATLFDCVKKAIEFGIPQADAFKMASETPANLLGLTNKGRLEIGADADFITVDENINLCDVVIGGKMI